MPAQIGYYDTLKSVAGKIFTYLASITIAGTDGKTITVTQDTSLDEAVAMSSKATQTAQANYFSSSTIVGWAASPTGSIFYKKIGKTVFVDFYITGTSNNTATSFTVPYQSRATGSDRTLFRAVNNSGAPVMAYGYIDPSTALVVLTSDLAVSAWTASGTKVIIGSIRYDVD